MQTVDGIDGTCRLSRRTTTDRPRARAYCRCSSTEFRQRGMLRVGTWSDAASRRYRRASVSAPTRRRHSRVDFVDAAARQVPAAFCPSAVGSVPSVEETNLFRSISHRPIPTRDLAHGWRSRLGVTARCRNALRAAQVNVNSPQPLFDYKSDVGAVRWWLTACLTSDDVRAHQILCVTRGELHALEEDVRWERIELQRYLSVHHPYQKHGLIRCTYPVLEVN